MNKRTTVLLGLACVLMSGVSLARNWNSNEKWRFTLSLVSFILFTLLYVGALYVTFIRKKKRE